jgi:HMG (high mobility group) box/HMG-box domain
MAPRKNAAALKPVTTNATPSSVMTPRRTAEVAMLKDENETLRAEMADLTAKLATVKVVSKENAPPKIAAVVAPPMPDMSLLDARMPAKPVRPTSSFLFFSASVRKNMQNVSAAVLSQKIGELWKALSDNDKKPFEEMHAAEKAVFDREMVKYNAAAAKIEHEKKALTLHYQEKRAKIALDFYDAQISGKPIQVAKKEDVKGAKDTDRIAPKKARTAYNIFCSDRREQLSKKTDEKIEFGELMKVVAADWAKLQKTKAGQKKLDIYTKRAAEEKDRYATELEAYHQLLAQDKATAVAEATRVMEAEKKQALKTYGCLVKAEDADAVSKKAARLQKKAKREAKALEPKRPSSAYIFYGQAERASVVASIPGAKQVDIMVEIARRWREATPDEKKRYEAEAAADKERYATEMKEFKPSV